MNALVIGLVAAVFLFVGVLLGTTMGAFAGWVVGGVFAETMKILIVDLLRLPPSVEPWQVGAMLGFIGTFFRPTLSAKSDS